MRTRVYASDMTPEELSGTILPRDADGLILGWQADIGQAFVETQWENLLGTDFACMKDRLPHLAGDELVPTSDRSLLVRLAAEEAGAATEILTSEERIVASTIVNSAETLPDVFDRVAVSVDLMASILENGANTTQSAVTTYSLRIQAATSTC